ncbi:hypothetical protein PHISCL_06376 [Aspergillus sclerotialis]|uniref:Zn(2)-C6 fungal-type domain-containing protein n=1 Tax=Aspergillus sclerotialis TaxID=2070753 RepID=A0A3A2ZFB8_9EURO|nr:hypothetical protein PHISCL_06376 [Aspergillus sclerotialis]
MECHRTVRISKACESCRRRKTRCDGSDPCRHCRAKRSPCTYRSKARTRLTSRSQGPLTPVFDRVGSVGVDSDRGEPTRNDATRPEVYHSVTASHNAPQPTDSSQLFYGPSSTFAFLQQIHRTILPNTRNAQLRGRDVQEAGPGLDAFMQRSIFFGTPLRTEMTPHYVSYPQARQFLEHFKASSHQALPFLTHSALDDLLPVLHSEASGVVGPCAQKKAVLLVVLAIGALSTPRTDLAEQLFIRAKQEAVIYEDGVTLPMIQFSILAADYQNNIGRPNSAYLHIGQASRKALAMGLHTATTSGVFHNEEELQERRRTTWCLYFLESWTCSAVGRKGVLTRDDIRCPFPDNQPLLVSHCGYATILQQACELIYLKNPRPLREVYSTAEGLYVRIRQWAKQSGLLPESNSSNEFFLDDVSKLMLYSGRSLGPDPSIFLFAKNVLGYFYLILLSFRPFLIAYSALKSTSSDRPTEELWIRQACRHATDAAQDYIVVVSNIFRISDACKVWLTLARKKAIADSWQNRRLNSFFLETSCAVLFYDSLCHPSKHPNNKEYIEIALSCLREIVGEDPAANTALSIRRILQAVEQSIPTTIPITTSNEAVGTVNPSGDSNQHQFQLLSFDGASPYTSQDLIFFGDRGLNSTSGVTTMTPSNAPQVGADGQALCQLDFDVMTTNLFNLFTMDPSSF